MLKDSPPSFFLVCIHLSFLNLFLGKEGKSDSLSTAQRVNVYLSYLLKTKNGMVSS